MSDDDRLRTVATRLGPLRSEVVFVGGMVRSLLVTDPGAGPARPTHDVDVIFDVDSRTGYDAVNKQLRQLGFREDVTEGAPLCRWIVDGVTVDIMPIDPAILGFSNVWYPSSIAHATAMDGFDGQIRVIDPAHFCATKLEAFASRSNGDLYHHDMEDVIAVVDGRTSLPDEIRRAPQEVREFIADKVTDLLARNAFIEAIPGHLHGDEASQGRLPMILDRLQRIAALGVEAAPESEANRSGPRLSVEPKSAPSASVASPLPGASDVVRVVSSNIRWIAYDASSSTLTMEFHGARLYDYYNVPSTVYAGLLRASSKGRYHHQWIKKRYRSKRRAR